MQIDDEDDLKAQLETGRLEPEPIDPVSIWWLVAQVKAISAPYTQTQAAQFALYRAMQKQNLN